MKKRQIVVAALGLVIVLTVIAFSFITITLKESVVISRSIYDVAPSYNNLRSWIRWHPDLRSRDNKTLKISDNSATRGGYLQTKNFRLTVTASNAASIVVKQEHSGDVIYQSLTGASDSAGRATDITWTQFLTGWQWLRASSRLRNQMRTGLSELRMNFVDPKRLYGFDLRIENVYDTSVVTIQDTVPVSEKETRIAELYNYLSKFYTVDNRRNHLYGYVTYNITESGRIGIAVGIPVYNTATMPPGARMLALPGTGRLLVGTYLGPYSKVDLLYAAMHAYMYDNRLKRAADPLEKYYPAERIAGDTAHQQIEIDFPIY